MKSGLIILDKPAGMTSACAVSIVKHHLPPRTRIGHAGTLDPFATGILILLVGKATRQFEQITSWPKTYRATIRLGATTPTDDPDSPVTEHHKQSILQTAIAEALKGFVGTIEQAPPRFSAVKINGKRASDYARQGSDIPLRPRTVEIHDLRLIDFEWPLLNLEIKCGRGTYIRSLARDLGEKLGVGGYVMSLRRTRVGHIDEAQARTLEQLDERIDMVPLTPAAEPLAH